MVDFIEWLEDNGIEYSTEGENVSKGWTGLNCIFCDDDLNHLGVTPDKTKFSCWKCGETGSIVKLIREILECSWGHAKDVVEELDLGEYALGSGSTDLSSYTSASSRSPAGKGILPNISSSLFPKPHRKYIRSRGFSLRHLKDEYKIRAVYTTSKYRFRIIIPYYLNGHIVNFVARDITNRAEKKYLACPNESAAIPIKSTFYNIDNVHGRKAVIVEGVTDVWSIGKGAIGASGTLITDEQLLLLTERRIKKVFIIPDEDAIEKAYRYANKLSAFMEVEIVELDRGDPNEQDMRTISSIRGLLL